ncbi:tetratricopeptide repeat protein [Kordiimonas sp. SCSIO 12603]|nr:tetratricopeptide repeat protein [Kordiimonas sp. SCSIO 12603]
MQNNQAENAEQLVRNILKQYPNEPNSLHLLGLILKHLGQFEEAINLLQKAISHGTNALAIQNSLGSTYYAQGNHPEALAIYDEILRQQPNHLDALYNSALAAIALDKPNTALEKALHGAKTHPDHIKFIYLEAQALALTGQIEAAVTKYKKLLSKAPDYFQATYSFALLLRENGRFEEAKSYILQATKLQPKSKEAWFMLANLHYQIGEAEEADIAFRRLLTLDPTHVEAHRLLNNLYFEFGYTDKFAKSFSIGIQHAPTSIPIRLAQIDSLLQAERYQDCANAIKQAEQVTGNHASLMVRSGMLKAKQNDFHSAVELLEKAHELAPDIPTIAITLARYMISASRENDALSVLDTAEKLSPFDQNLWALRGTAWHLMGDHKKADWLFGYDRFVDVRTIHTPDGYTNIQEFLEHLTNHLETLHTTQHAPIDQTLRNGTQTVGQLFDHNDPILQLYKHALNDTVKYFIDTLPTDSEHPFLKRNTGAFRFSSSWSVRLTKTGFHVSHVHPAGWLSSAFYVAFDKSTVSDDPKKPDGWLHFGVPGLALPGRDISPARLVKPEPGLLALFPSYCWHGTHPIANEGMRLTAPFDVIPI